MNTISINYQLKGKQVTFADPVARYIVEDDTYIAAKSRNKIPIIDIFRARFSSDGNRGINLSKVKIYSGSQLCLLSLNRRMASVVRSTLPHNQWLCKFMCEDANYSAIIDHHPYDVEGEKRLAALLKAFIAAQPSYERQHASIYLHHAYEQLQDIFEKIFLIRRGVLKSLKEANSFSHIINAGVATELFEEVSVGCWGKKNPTNHLSKSIQQQVSVEEKITELERWQHGYGCAPIIVKKLLFSCNFNEKWFQLEQAKKTLLMLSDQLDIGIIPALKDEDSSSETRMSARKNVLGSVHITV